MHHSPLRISLNDFTMSSHTKYNRRTNTSNKEYHPCLILSSFLYEYRVRSLKTNSRSNVQPLTTIHTRNIANLRKVEIHFAQIVLVIYSCEYISFSVIISISNNYIRGL